MAQEQGILEYLHELPEVPATTVRVFEKDDYYIVYGENAVFLAKSYFMTTASLKVIESDMVEIQYLTIGKRNFVAVLKFILFSCQYKIEIHQTKGSGKRQEWMLGVKGSPGNITQLEDILFDDDNVPLPSSKGVIALKINIGLEMNIGVAYCDAMLRQFQICQFTDTSDFFNLQSILVQMTPKECLMVKITDIHLAKKLKQVLELHNVLITDCKPGDFSASDVFQDLSRLLKDDEMVNLKQNLNTDLNGEPELKLALSGVAAIIKYFGLLGDPFNFGKLILSVFHPDQYAKVDIQSVKSLQLFPVNPEDNKSVSLLGLLNKCRTPQGERYLRQVIKKPLMDVNKLEQRLDLVEMFVNNVEMRQNLYENHLRKIPDLEMLSRRIQRRKASLQDIHKIYSMLIQLPSLISCLSMHNESNVCAMSEIIDDLQGKVDDFQKFVEMIESTLDLEAIKEKRYVIKAEYNSQLLELQHQMKDLHQSVERIFRQMPSELGLNEGKVKLEYNDTLGYHFRVARKDEKILRDSALYRVIDSKTSGVRFHNVAMKVTNDKYLSLLNSYEEKQKVIVEEIIEIADSYHHLIEELGATIARLDVSVAFACVSVSSPKPYVRPKLKGKGQCNIILKQARHPILELQPDLDFIPNDFEIKEGKYMFYFITGPNMGGKSTYIRTVAICVLMAQIGCFVPCDEAEISVVDAFLTRIGASDMPIKGISTFMAEMMEVNNMLKSATCNSLLIIDEMGRGTSTYDGFGLSWAISWYIADQLKAPCLFATHFHELTELAKEIRSVGNLHVEALSSNNKITFLYRVIDGISDESFGINVAEMAHFPVSITELAKEKLNELNKETIPLEDIFKIFMNYPHGNVITEILKSVNRVKFENLCEPHLKDLSNVKHVNSEHLAHILQDVELDSQFS